MNEELYRIVNIINIDDMKNFTKQCLEKYSNDKKIEEANNVADILIALLKKKKLLTDPPQTFVDILLSATMLHNLTFEHGKDSWIKIYETRGLIEEDAKEFNIPSSVLDSLYSTIEGQLGDDMPIKGSVPNPNTPGELFSLAIFFAKEYK